MVGTVDNDEWTMGAREPTPEHDEDGVDARALARQDLAVDEVIERVRQWLFEGGSHQPPS